MRTNDIRFLNLPQDRATENRRIEPHPVNVDKVDSWSKFGQDQTKIARPRDIRADAIAEDTTHFDGMNERRIVWKGGMEDNPGVHSRQHAGGYALLSEGANHCDDCERGPVVRSHRRRDVKHLDRSLCYRVPP